MAPVSAPPWSLVSLGANEPTTSEYIYYVLCPPYTDILITLSANCPPLRCSVFVFVACLYQSPLCGQPIWCGHPTRNENCRLKQFPSQNMWKYCVLFLLRISLTNIRNGCLMFKLDKHQHKCFISVNISNSGPGVWPGRGPGSNWWLAPLSLCCLPVSSAASLPQSHLSSLQRLQRAADNETTQIYQWKEHCLFRNVKPNWSIFVYFAFH